VKEGNKGKKCKRKGHKWVPMFIKGTYNNKVVKFIACYCERCNKGWDEAGDINEIAINREYGTYAEKYFDGFTGVIK